MSGFTNDIGSRSRIVEQKQFQSNETVTVYIEPSQANAGQTDCYATWDYVRSWTPNYSRWMSFSGEDVTLQPGIYDLTFQMLTDYIGTGTSFHHKIFGRNAVDSSPGKIISQAYGNASGTHTNFPSLTTVLTCQVPTIVKCSTKDGGDGHTLYFGGENSGSIGGNYTFLKIVKHYVPSTSVLPSFDTNTS